ncbi:sugar transferase [Tessaracoccus aquimaris]|uniref:sugar transferase n=1 Tax=Tessaracoccus aquimaris TaxID=1332264 RepID=UPI0022B25CF0|nr:sugar transferase [Tessaracoccus aquimaris]
MDIVTSAVGIVATAPLQALTALVVLMNFGRPVLFRQDRPGKDGRIFRLTKFRTMREPTASLVTDEQRLTRCGRLLRSTSLDELPTLWNVLKGDMSLVGPRPLLEKYLSRYTPEQARRHEVRPGITGLAQTRGRNALPWETKLRLDVEYVERRSMSLDLCILLATVATVTRRQGIGNGPLPTMVEFHGTHPGDPRDA